MGCLLTSSPILTAAQSSMAVSSGSGGSGDNNRGGQPHRTFILRGRYPQISQSTSWWFSARARETSTGGSRGCQSFFQRKGEIAGKSCSYAHNRHMSHPRTHLQRVGSPDTEDNDHVNHPRTGNDRNQKDTDKMAS